MSGPLPWDISWGAWTIRGSIWIPLLCHILRYKGNQTNFLPNYQSLVCPMDAQKILQFPVVPYDPNPELSQCSPGASTARKLGCLKEYEEKPLFANGSFTLARGMEGDTEQQHGRSCRKYSSWHILICGLWHREEGEQQSYFHQPQQERGQGWLDEVKRKGDQVMWLNGFLLSPHSSPVRSSPSVGTKPKVTPCCPSAVLQYLHRYCFWNANHMALKATYLIFLSTFSAWLSNRRLLHLQIIFNTITGCKWGCSLQMINHLIAVNHTGRCLCSLTWIHKELQVQLSDILKL